MIDELQDELHLLDFLRQVYLQEPSRDFVCGILTLDAADNIDEPLAEGLQLMMADARKNQERISAWLEELAIEFARLFIGPKNPLAVPYASYYLSGSHALMTDETIAVRQTYLDAGMQVKALHRIPDDHVGIELEFLFCLTDKIIRLHESGADGESARLYEMRESFLQKHCVLWFPEFAKRIIDNTSSDYFLGSALLLKDCVEGVQHV